MQTSAHDQHGHSHGDGDSHGHDHSHPHDHEHSLWQQLKHTLSGHSHSHAPAALDPALATSRGIWALKVSLIGLLVTAIFQVVIVALSGSVALLADTVHNFSDALTALPLWLAFALARRRPDRRYSYGYGRAEDLAGALIVLMILSSALVVFYESYQHFIHLQPLSNLGWVMAAAIVGFLGNEAVAVFRIRVGRQIGSAALVADGLHARVDGLTSLGVLAGTVGVALGFPLADPMVGVLIGVAILFVVRSAVREMWYRLMDAVDPSITLVLEGTAQSIDGVRGVHDLRVRWLGHRLHLELHVEVDGCLPTIESHRIVEQVRHDLFHVQPALAEAVVHADPCECDGQNHHELTLHHVSH
jgi:cation diffusion facilitator family transporter